MNPTLTKTAVELLVVVASAGLLLELAGSRPWAPVVLGLAAIVWLLVRRN